MATIHIDETRWPLVLVTFDGVSPEPEFDAYLERMATFLDRKTPTATVLDATRAGATPPIQRKKQADWMKTHEASLRRYSAGTAFVISSPMVRGILTAILWMQPMPQEHVVVATLPEAMKWAREKLRARGVELAA